LAEIFDITHETGDLSQYDSTVTDGGKLSVAGGAALIGSYGLQAVIDDTTSKYGQMDFTLFTSTTYRFRIYLDPNGLTMSSGDVFTVCTIFNSSSPRARIQLYYSGGNYQIRLLVRNDAAGNDISSYYVITDASHYIEVLIEYASSDVASDGQGTLWIDGSQKEVVSGIDLYDLSKPDRARLGAVADLDSGTSGTLYLDDFVLRDDSTEIGAGGGPSPSTVIVNTLTLASSSVTLAGLTSPLGSGMKSLDFVIDQAAGTQLYEAFQNIDTNNIYVRQVNTSLVNVSTEDFGSATEAEIINRIYKLALYVCNDPSQANNEDRIIAFGRTQKT